MKNPMTEDRSALVSLSPSEAAGEMSGASGSPLPAASSAELAAPVKHSSRRRFRHGKRRSPDKAKSDAPPGELLPGEPLVTAWADAPRTLSREEINLLPIRAYGGEIGLIRTEEEQDRALNLLWKEKILGFDTETRPVFTRGRSGNPALVQLGGENCVFLFQLNCVPFGEALADLLANPHIIKAGVAVRDDLRALARLHDFTPGGAVDLAHLAKARGIQAQGLRSLAAALLGFRISKSAQCSNWDNVELTPRQLLYAATDAWVGRELYLRLAQARPGEARSSLSL